MKLSYIFFSLFIINTIFNIDFIIFDIESMILVLKNMNITSYVILFKKKINLLSFKDLTIC